MGLPRQVQIVGVFVAGAAAVRAKAIQDAWADESIAALIAMRGGYGSATGWARKSG